MSAGKQGRFAVEVGPVWEGLDESVIVPRGKAKLKLAQNVRVDWTSGELVKRPGTTRASNNTSSVAIALTRWQGAVVAATSTGSLEYFSPGTTASAVAIINATSTHSYDPGTPPNFTVFANAAGAKVLYFADNSTNSLCYINSSFAPTNHLANTPNVRCLASYNNRLWALGNTSSTYNTLYYSTLGNGDTLGTAAGGGEIILNAQGEGVATAIIPLGQSLMIINNNGLSRLTGYGLDDIAVSSAVRLNNVTVGSLIQRSVIVVDDQRGFFTGTDAIIYEFTEFGITPVSQAIQSSCTAGVAVTGTLILAATSDLTLAVPNDKEVWFFFAATKRIYVYNYALRVWTGPWLNANGSSPIDTTRWYPVATYVTPVNTTITIPVVYIVSGTDVNVYRMTETITTDLVASGGAATSGTAISMTIKTTPIPFFDDLFSEGALRFVYAVFSHVANIVFTTDCSNGVQVQATMTGGGTDLMVRERAQGSGNGSYVSLGVIDSTAYASRISVLGCEGFSYGRRLPNATAIA